MSRIRRDATLASEKRYAGKNERVGRGRLFDPAASGSVVAKKLPRCKANAALQARQRSSLAYRLRLIRIAAPPLIDLRGPARRDVAGNKGYPN